MKHYRGRTAVAGSLIAIAAMIGLAIVSPGLAGSKPLNAGKTGFKSNAGAGNGTEDVQIGEPTTVTISSSIETNTTTSTSGEPEVVSTIITKTPIGSTFLKESQVGNSANFKRWYDVTYQVVTTVGTETVVTYETVRETKVFATEVTTTDMADVDPGNSQDHNQAPEGQPADIVSSAEPQLISSYEEVVASSQEVVPNTTSSSETSTAYSQQVLCNGSEGTNPGTGYCSGL